MHQTNAKKVKNPPTKVTLRGTNSNANLGHGTKATPEDYQRHYGAVQEQINKYISERHGVDVLCVFLGKKETLPSQAKRIL